MASLDWAVLATAVALISFFITVLVHMASKAMSLQNAEMWAKSEYAQAAVSFLIIFFAIAMQTAGASAVSQVTAAVASASGNLPLTASLQNSLGDPNTIAKAYIQTVIACEVNIYRLVYIPNLYIEMSSKFSIAGLGSEALGAGFALTGWVSLFHYIMNNIVYLVLYHYMQHNVIVFSQYTMLPVFLPIGLVLRAFAPTRGAGGFITAFALGFAFVFPMSYVLIVALMPSYDTYCGQVTAAADPDSPLFGNANPCFNSVGGSMAGYYRLKSIEHTLPNLMDKIGAALHLLFLQAVFYPLASLIVTFSFIRQTGNLFGADLAEIGRGLIKII